MQNFSKTPIKVIGVGNAWRGDDAVGLMVARRLKQENLPKVEIAECPGSGCSLADAWQDAASVIVVDAMASGAPPGTISRFDGHDSAETFLVSRSSSSHSWGLSEALALGKVFQNLPPVLIIYGIEGEHFTIDNKLSPAVAAAIPEAVRRIAEEIQALARRQADNPNKPPCNSSERRNDGT
jgi:hydrogenase maturation protease